MEWQKGSQAVAKLLEDALAGFPCTKKTMFGYPAYFVNGNMFAGVFRDQLFLRLSGASRRELEPVAPDVRSLEPMPGRPMEGYAVLPEALYGQPEALRAWVRHSFDFVSTLPPKEPAPKKSGR